MFCAGRHLELLGDLPTMLIHQAMTRRIPASVTGVARHLRLNSRLLVVQFGPQNLCILGAFLSHHYLHHQRLVGRGRQGSGQHRLLRSRGTLKLMFLCSHGKRWADHTWWTAEIDLHHGIYHPVLATLMFFIQMRAAKVQPTLQLKRCRDGTDEQQQTMRTLHIWWHVPAIGGQKKKVLQLLNDCADKLLNIWLVDYGSITL